MNEEVAAQNYLKDLLDADTALSGMVEGVRLRTTEGTLRTPFVKIDRQDASDLMVVSLRRVWADLSFLIRGIVHWTSGGDPDWADVQAIADRLDTLLHGHEGTDGTVYVHAFREESFTDETIESGDLYLHAGGIYRVRAQAVAAA